METHELVHLYFMSQTKILKLILQGLLKWHQGNQTPGAQSYRKCNQAPFY